MHLYEKCIEWDTYIREEQVPVLVAPVALLRPRLMPVLVAGVPAAGTSRGTQSGTFDSMQEGVARRLKKTNYSVNELQ